MPSTRDIRRRIKSVKNTAQITKAMQLVAASKMKKAQDQALAGRPYADLMNKVIVNLKNRSEEATHELFDEREGGKEILVVVSTDKGLCGGLNTNLLKSVLREITEDTQVVTVGRKLRGTLARLKKDLVADFSIKDPVHFSEAKSVSKFVIDQFRSGEVNRVRVAFTNFVSTLTQKPCVDTLLPVSPIQLGGGPRDWEGMGQGEAEQPKEVPNVGYLFEPSAAAVFEEIVPQYIHYQFYQMVLEARASEHSARMVAMKSATDNAKQMVKDLTLEYNKVRQAAITGELLEITTAMRAME